MDQFFVGYPPEVFYAAALIGVVLVIFRPKWAFLFIVFGLSVRHFHMATFTRTPFLGPFVNLNDLFLWIGVAALIRIAMQGEKIWVPKILLAIIFILAIGTIQSLFQYGFNYAIMQSLWACWIFPIMFLISVNMVRNIEDGRLFCWALFIGALGAALQHLFFIKGRALNSDPMSLMVEIRTISFGMSGGLFLFLSLFFVDFRRILKRLPLFLLWVIGLSLIGISFVLSLTRTWWIGGALAIVALFIVNFQERRAFLHRLGYSLSILVGVLVIFYVTNSFLVSQVNLAQPIEERMQFLQYSDAFESAYQKRETGMQTELGLWKNGLIIWGVGATYPPSLLESSIEETGALSHVAYSMYLAHFGLIGLLVYGFFLPLLTIKLGKKIFSLHKLDYGAVIAITGMALGFFDIFTLLSSNHYLASTSQVPGLIYGSIWGLSRILQTSPAENYAKHSLFNKTFQQRLPEPIN